MRGFSFVKQDKELYQQVAGLFLTEENRNKFETKYINNIAFDAACRLTRYFHAEHNEFIRKIIEAARTLRISTDESRFTDVPLIVLDKRDPKKLTTMVFPNIKLKNSDPSQMKVVSAYVFPELLDPVAEELIKRKDHLVDYARRWRAIKRVEKDMSIERILTRYCGHVFKGQPPSIIRDIADLIAEEYKPIKLHYAETPEEMLKMYSSGPSSCMSYRSDLALQNISKDYHPQYFHFLGKYFNTHPGEWYIRAGGKGAYIQKGKTVVARTILFPMEDGSFRHGRTYASTSLMLERFQEALKSAGHAPLGSGDKNGHWSRSVDFKIPVYKNEGKGCVPLPYFDNLSGSLVAKYLPDEDCVHFKLNSKEKSKDYVAVSGAQKGYLHLDDLILTNCEVCNAVIRPHQIIEIDGHKRCAHCTQKMGFVNAYQVDGAPIWKHRNECYRDADGRYFTTLLAGARHGYVPVFNTLDVLRRAVINNNIPLDTRLICTTFYSLTNKPTNFYFGLNNAVMRNIADKHMTNANGRYDIDYRYIKLSAEEFLAKIEEELEANKKKKEELKKKVKKDKEDMYARMYNSNDTVKITFEDIDPEYDNNY